jgi:hypothetical protein
LTVTCKSVAPADGDLSCQEVKPNGQIVWNFTPEDYTDRVVAPGTYVFTYEVTAAGGDEDLTVTFDVTITLIDPCVNPSFTVPSS